MTSPMTDDTSVKANERVVEAFLEDVVNEHNGDHAANYMNPDMQWSGGTVGTVTGRDNVAGLFASVVVAFPDARITINDIFGQGDQVVVRVVVSGTQQGAIIGIPASGRYVQWDGVDVYGLSDGKISNIWAGDDGIAILNDTARTRHPGSPERIRSRPSASNQVTGGPGPPAQTRPTSAKPRTSASTEPALPRACA